MSARVAPNVAWLRKRAASASLAGRKNSASNESVEMQSPLHAACAVAAKQATVEAPAQRRAPNDAGLAQNAAVDRPELRGGLPVEQLSRAAAPVAGGRHEHDEHEGEGLQPVQPQRPTPP